MQNGRCFRNCRSNQNSVHRVLLFEIFTSKIEAIRNFLRKNSIDKYEFQKHSKLGENLTIRERTAISSTRWRGLASQLIILLMYFLILFRYGNYLLPTCTITLNLKLNGLILRLRKYFLDLAERLLTPHNCKFVTGSCGSSATQNPALWD